MTRSLRQIRSIAEIMNSPKLEAILVDLGQKVLASASSDPNREYVNSLDLHVFHSKGKSGSRVVVQVGASPVLGMAVEAKRGTLARALGSLGGGVPEGPPLVNYTTKDGRTRKATQAQVDAWTKSRK